MHTPLIGDHVYRQQLRHVAQDDDLEATTFSYVADTLLRMDTRDPLRKCWWCRRCGRMPGSPDCR